MDIDRLSVSLDDFKASAQKGVSWVETKKWFSDRLGIAPREEELKLAISRHGAFLMDDGDWTVRLRCPCFLGRNFSVIPSGFELEKGIFLPGGNLLPALPYDRHPSDADFLYRGLPLPLLACELPEKELEKRFSLFGKEQAGVLIGIDSYEARPKRGEGPGSPFLTRTRAFDAAALFADPDFSAPRGLILRMSKPGVFELRPALPEESPDKARRKKNLQALASAFSRTFSFFSPEIGMDAQIAQTYWFAFREEPPKKDGRCLPAFSDFMESEYAPVVFSLGLDSFLCPRGQEGAAKRLSENSPHPDINGRGLDRIFQAIGLPLRSPEVEALIRSLPDSDPDAVMESLSDIFPDSVAFSAHPEFRACLEGLAAYVRKSADPFLESRVRPLREQALGHLLRSLFRVTRRLGDAGKGKPADIDPCSAEQLLSELRGLIAFLNAPSPLNDQRLSELSGAIGEMGAALDIFLSSPSPSGKAKSVSGSKGVRLDTGGYLLSLTLAGLRPPVTRVLSVPGATDLGFLSECFEAAFSWSGRHVHCFRIGDRVYGKRDVNSLPRERDENEAFLGGLGLAVGDQFEYEYDFGSSWIIIAKVEETRPYEGESPPRCVSGRGTAPQEDSGGPLAYSRMLGAWKDKRSPDYDTYRTLVGPAWNPDRFEAREVDDALKALASRKRR